MADPLPVPLPPPVDERPRSWLLGWQRELTRRHYGEVLARAHRLMTEGSEAEIEECLLEIRTAQRSLKHSHSGLWKRLLARAAYDLDGLLVELSYERDR